MDSRTTRARFIYHQKECLALFDDRQAQYGNSIHKTGVLGAVVEIVGACARLPLMVLKQEDHGRMWAMKLMDVFMDIHNYATIALIMIENNNWEGE